MHGHGQAAPPSPSTVSPWTVSLQTVSPAGPCRPWTISPEHREPVPHRASGVRVLPGQSVDHWPMDEGRASQLRPQGAHGQDRTAGEGL